MADVASATKEVRHAEEVLAQCKLKESQTLKILHDTRVLLAQERAFEADLYIGYTQGLLSRRVEARRLISEALRSQPSSSQSHVTSSMLFSTLSVSLITYISRLTSLRRAYIYYFSFVKTKIIGFVI